MAARLPLVVVCIGVVVSSGCKRKETPTPTPTPSTLCAELVHQKVTAKCETKSGFKDIPAQEVVGFEVRFAGERAFLGEYAAFSKEEDLERYMVRTTDVQKRLARDLFKRELPERGLPRFAKNRGHLLLAVVIPATDRGEEKERIVMRLVEQAGN